MKNKLITVILIMTALLMLSSCITVIGTDDEPVEGKIISVTKHGNAITDISNEEAEKHGIAVKIAKKAAIDALVDLAMEN